MAVQWDAAAGGGPPGGLPDQIAAVVDAVFGRLNGTATEEFERAAIEFGLLGRCDTCNLNVPVNEIGPCPECGGHVTTRDQR